MPRENQVYEDYWSITFAYTNIYGEKFHTSLKLILDFIDQNNITLDNYNDDLYNQLQQRLNSVYEMNEISIRKIINQYVKLGFVNYKLAGYHPDARKFLISSSNEEKQIIFSKIVYQSSNFKRDVTEYNDDQKPMNFLLKTLAYSGPLTEDDRIALMLTDLSRTTRDFLTRDELEEKKRYAEIIDFKERKYNQIDHFTNLLGKLSDVFLDNNKTLYLTEDDMPDDIEELEKRDPYLHRLYKSTLKEESVQLFDKEICYLEKLDYPSLVASHIKPFKKSNPSEQYDKNNGLLLSRGMDALFDKGYISFNDDGTIILSDRLSKDVKEHLKNYSLDSIILNEQRLEYLHYNREFVFK
jgi:type-2 restriction enzyme hphI